MILTGLLIFLFIALLIAGSRGSLPAGVGLLVLATVGLWPEFFDFSTQPGLLPDLYHLMPINAAAWGVAIMASSWRDSLETGTVALFIPPMLLSVASSYYMISDPSQFQNTLQGNIGLALAVILFKLTIVISSWSVAYRAQRLVKKAKGEIERFLLWSVYSMSVLGIVGAGIGVASGFLKAVDAGVALIPLERSANALATAGGAGITLVLLYCAVSTISEKLRTRGLLRRDMQLLEEAWVCATESRPEILHPRSGRTVEERAHRMVVEIRDASADCHGDPDYLPDDLYEAIERVEDTLTRLR